MGYLSAGGSIQRVQTVVAVNQLEVEAREKRGKRETEGMVREEEAAEDAGGQSLTEMWVLADVSVQAQTLVREEGRSAQGQTTRSRWVKKREYLVLEGKLLEHRCSDLASHLQQTCLPWWSWWPCYSTRTVFFGYRIVSWANTLLIWVAGHGLAIVSTISSYILSFKWHSITTVHNKPARLVKRTTLWKI